MRQLLYGLLFTASLLTTGGLINRFADHPKGVLGDQFHYFEKRKDDFEILLFGSSRTYAGVIPPQLDAALAAAGHPLSSFNLAFLGMRPHEVDAMLRRTLALEPARLKLVVVEFGYWTSGLRPRRRYQPRSFMWHDWRTTLAAIRSIGLPGQGARWGRDGALGVHLSHFAGHATALARGPDVVRSLFGKRRIRHRAWLTKDRGYREPGWKTDDTSFSLPCGASKGDDQMALYHRKVKRMRNKPRTVHNLDRFDVESLKARSTAITQAGAIVVHFVPPTLKETPEVPLLIEAGLLENPLSYNSPVEYPQLYALENRWDCDHLKRGGAEILSQLLAEQLAKILDRG